MKTSNAFTLIEIMIVLAVIAAMSGLGVTAIIQFRRGVELNNGVTEFNSIIQTIKNNALNAVSTGGVSGNTPDYYVLEFGTTGIQSKNCMKSGSSGTVCTNGPLLNEPSEIDWYPGSTQPCHSIGFERRTGDLVIRQSNGTILTTGSCRVQVTLKSNSGGSNPQFVKTFIFNAADDKYSIQ